MKGIVFILALVLLASTVAAAEGAHTYYVQLIRGTDTAQAPQPKCRHAGPKLAATFGPVFKWTNYWELSLREATLRPGEKARLRLSPEREVEIDLAQPKERKITAFENGKVTDCTVSPAGEHMTIIGGKREASSGWFIVVRRDKPKD